jgi:hypothetical protein
MNHDDPDPPRVPHPFFHTMVMMGSALALGCGGLSESKSSDDDTTAGTGGSSVGGMATAGAGGGGIAVGTGGTGNAPVTPGPFPCASETLSCKTPPPCAGGNLVLPNDCTCDGTRPASAEACAAGQSFVCRQARSNESYQPFTEPVPFSCSCMPTGLSCEALCDEAFGSQAGQGTCLSATTAQGKESVLCGCGRIGLR